MYFSNLHFLHIKLIIPSNFAITTNLGQWFSNDGEGGQAGACGEVCQPGDTLACHPQDEDGYPGGQECGPPHHLKIQWPWT